MKYKIKYRVKHYDASLLAFIFFPLALLGDTSKYYVQKFSGIWPFGKWKDIYKTNSKSEAYIFLMKEKYNLEVPQTLEWNWNARYNWFSKIGKLKLIERKGNFFAGYYDEEKSKYKIYYISKVSFEDAIVGLINIVLKITYKHKCEYDKINI